MSLHPSLRGGSQMRRHRSVLTRLERLKLLLGKGTWNETLSPLGLPKVKNLKVTVKKEKTAVAEGAAGAAPAAGAPAPAGAAKPAAGGAAPAKKADAPKAK